MGNKAFSSAQNEDSKNKFRGSWFGSLRRSKSKRRMSWVPRPHMDISTWLHALHLPQYQNAFTNFSGVEEFLYYDERSIQELGVVTPAHLAKIMFSLHRLREKYEKSHKLKPSDCNQRISLIEPQEKRKSISFNSLPKPPDIPVPPVPPEEPIRYRTDSWSLDRNVKKRRALLSTSRIVSVDEMSEVEADLRKALEVELSLDSEDLRSHAWYHGTIPRVRAEEIVTDEGQFLVRDCISKPGDYVLTCKWNNQLLHFIIQKGILQPNTVYERIQYQLEDEAYDTLPDLVRAYVGNKKPVTLSSGARILSPVNRTAPLSYYASKYAAQTAHTLVHGTLTRNSTPKLQYSRQDSNRYQHPIATGIALSEPVAVGCSFIRSPAHTQSPPRIRRESGSSLTSKTRPASTNIADDKMSHSSDGIIGHLPTRDKSNVFSSHSLPRKMLTSKSLSITADNIPSTLSEMCEGTKPHDKLSLQDISTSQPPPKPSRVPSTKVKPKKPETDMEDRIYANSEEVKEIATDSKTPTGLTSEHIDGMTSLDTALNPRHSRLSEVYQPSGSDSGNGSGDSVQTSTSDARNRDSQTSFGENGSSNIEDEDFIVEEESIPLVIPDMTPPSSFDLENFNTFLLPTNENKPLEATALRAIKNTLMDYGSRMLAALLTRTDLDVLNGPTERDFGLGVTSGIELCTLPQGSQLRKDLIERTESFKLLVAITVLKTEDLNERAELIHKWIQIAIDTKTAMGNLYGFTGIMLGLCIPEIQKLTSTWHLVRQKYTDSAFNFESKLRATLKAMNECNNPQAPNTIIPHLLPFVLLCERDLDDIYSLHTKGGALLQWESTASDYGLQMLLNHLQEARAIGQNLSLYKRNAQLILGEINFPVDELAKDIFKTEFHMKFLYGSNGATADSYERTIKFQKVIETLSNYCEPVQA